MPKKIDITGKQFGRLTVVGRERPSSSGWLWRCQCECGNVHIAKTGLLTNGNTKSCGCLKSEAVTARNYRHGLLIRGKQSAEFYAFLNAKRRCQNPEDRSYKRYGARGIRFLFTSFDQFIEHLGPRPSPQHSLDRINNAGHYELGNVRWATIDQQATNKRHNSRKGHQGFVKTM